MLDEDLYKLYPKLLTEYKLLEPHIKEKIVEVAHRFRNQQERQDRQQGTTHILRLQRVNSHINMIKITVPVCIICRTQSALINAAL